MAGAIAIGSIAPDFELPGTVDETVRLKDQLEKGRFSQKEEYLDGKGKSVYRIY